MATEATVARDRDLGTSELEHALIVIIVRARLKTSSRSIPSVAIFGF